MTASRRTGSARSSSTRARPRAPSSRTRSTRCTRPRASTPACRGRLTRTTSRSRTRSGTSSTAPRLTRRPASACVSDRQDKEVDARRRRLLQPGRLDAGSRSAAASAPTTTSTARRTRRSGPGRDGPGRNAAPPGAGHVREPALQRTARTTTGSRSRPTCRGSRRTARARPCNRTTGRGLREPAAGRATSIPSTPPDRPTGGCVWQIGGPDIPSTTNKFGGNSTAEFGPLLKSAYPDVGGQPVFRFNNFRRVLDKNPCPAATQ